MRRDELIASAISAGADVAGIAPAVLHDEHQKRFVSALERGDHGFLQWLNMEPRSRHDARFVLPSARSVLMIGVSCKHEAPEEDSSIRIARYAQGRDYHRMLKKLLTRVARCLETELPALQWRACVDTAPLLERAFAWRAGLGWIGKNTMLIHPDYGSWLMLGALVVNQEYEPGTPMKARCGTCRRCLEACPSGALYKERQLKADRCNSALNIEYRARVGQSAPEFSAEQAAQLPPWLFGCDTCQEVCPWNRNAKASRTSLLAPENELVHQLSDAQWLDLENEAAVAASYESITRGRVLRRMTPSMYQRNLRLLQAAKGSSGIPSLVP